MRVALSVATAVTHSLSRSLALSLSRSLALSLTTWKHKSEQAAYVLVSSRLISPQTRNPQHRYFQLRHTVQNQPSPEQKQVRPLSENTFYLSLSENTFYQRTHSIREHLLSENTFYQRTHSIREHILSHKVQNQPSPEPKQVRPVGGRVGAWVGAWVPGCVVCVCVCVCVCVYLAPGGDPGDGGGRRSLRQEHGQGPRGAVHREEQDGDLRLAPHPGCV